ncbi:MAG: zinc-dependent alcohol dehydrogenase family protein, partial [Pseudomonadota bacterium]|nr:zinc-dependent alcohol dehydrogenase family protein [Pseudomonadota bacterium]
RPDPVGEWRLCDAVSEMKRIVRFDRIGGPEVLRIEDAAPEPPRPDEVLIAVAAFGLNNSEAQLRRGDYPMQAADFPSRIGRECTGTVVSVGDAVKAFRPGERVSTIPAFDVKRNGVYGEWAVVPEAGVVLVPKGLDAPKACAIWQQYLTAYGPLVLHADCGPEDVVLITAAASSVGLGAVQMAKARGSRVVATTRTPTKRDMLQAVGADRVVVLGQEELEPAVMEVSGGKGFTICMDPVAGPGLETLVACAAREARIFLYGQLAGEATPLPLVEIMRRGVGVRGYTLWEITLDAARRAAAIDYILRGVESGVLDPVIDRVMAFDEIVEAHRYLETGKQAGKIVIAVNGETHT